MLINETIDTRSILTTSASPKDREDMRKRTTEHIVLITFLSHCFTNLAEVGVLRRCLKEIYSLAVWRHLQPARLAKELATVPRYKKILNKLEKRVAGLEDSKEVDRLSTQRAFAAKFIDKFLATIEGLPPVQKVRFNTVLKNKIIFSLHFSNLCSIFCPFNV